ncbi:cbb3-type cytochrome c oxidase subunit I [Fibrella aquatilis]|uniref:Cbb3-type cytochrome c oxidase subunit I n=1 Tax=Fibrella aquatilis TaxID=2817059 RepID=A0A939G182_9BACT|nr:cbb3-type cytochrome c oxidase subunit I [Fibrella aquatilis]MBO0929368.1 cbb3-type cytochrome c oxidase subunit I [Fibrella aquatilis]
MESSILNRWHWASLLLVLSVQPVLAQGSPVGDVWSQPGIIGTIILLVIVMAGVLVLAIARLGGVLNKLSTPLEQQQNETFEETVANLTTDQLDQILERRQARSYQLTGRELGSEQRPQDEKGLVSHVTTDMHAPLVAEKKHTLRYGKVEPALIRLIAAYLLSAAFWLVFGTAIGWYVGIKFVRPDIDHVAWLSFGRLRPVHTNTVFWGWSSLSMLGLGLFVVTRTSNTRLFSYRLGWLSLGLINACLVLGTLCLMNGINNGGGEYREFIWPVMALFAIGLVISLYNFYQTVAHRQIEEMYISNWYMLGALSWVIILSVIAYLPFYQNGLGETVIQGYYMHQGVGMWFMSFTLGLVYYFLPMSLNKPIYSYSLGVLAFWTQLLFYTLIGTHHYVFSPVPWWLQAVAIVFSAGMFIPVLAGTTNFVMTFRGSGKHVTSSYSLPFLAVGVLFYFTGSVQGSMQAFRFTNVVWHFTDFNVAHSHITMYGIIAFLLWGCIYTLVPRFMGREPRQLLVGIHFWFALLGLLAYIVSMMIGGTLKGLSWLDGEPFIKSVVLMAPFWVWRAIGGTLMLLSHFVFAFNLYEMLLKSAPASEASSVPHLNNTHHVAESA